MEKNIEHSKKSYKELSLDFKEDICREQVIGETLLCTGTDAKPIYIRYNSLFKDNYMLAENEEIHTHNYYELTMVLRGEFAVNINNNIYQINPGDIVAFRPGEPHFHTNTQIGDLEYLEINIAKDTFENIPGGNILLRCFKERQFCEKNITSTENNMSNVVTKSVRKLISHLNTGKDNQLLIYSYFIQFMYAVNDAFGQQTSGISDRYIPDILYAAIDYIRRNLTTVQNLNEISQHLGISVSYLCRIFKSHLEMTPHEYIISHRIEYAKALLANSDMNISQVCYESGFNDYSSFISLFRKKVGITPLAYRKSF
ncbi:MAG: helix-turn-helix transcriptional regulator [Clostridia bacterium]|nr:helix-turn-helix transcriptional regulator [Clostridia bacterium]